MSILLAQREEKGRRGIATKGRVREDDSPEVLGAGLVFDLTNSTATTSTTTITTTTTTITPTAAPPTTPALSCTARKNEKQLVIL